MSHVRELASCGRGPWDEAAMRAKLHCAVCGRTVLIRYRGRVFVPRDDEHDLCQRCWQAQVDRSRVVACDVPAELSEKVEGF